MIGIEVQESGMDILEREVGFGLKVVDNVVHQTSRKAAFAWFDWVRARKLLPSSSFELDVRFQRRGQSWLKLVNRSCIDTPYSGFRLS